MISIVGCDEGPEADAARQIRDAIRRAWPWIDEETAAEVYLIPNVQCHGESVRDIDLVLLASISADRARFQPAVPARLLAGNEVHAPHILVRSLCLVIEVKDHDAENVRFNGTKVEVRYASDRDKWHSATQQSERQKYSLRNYLIRHLRASKAPHVTNLIWLRNVTRDSIPRGADNVFPSVTTWSGFLNGVLANGCVWPDAGGFVLSAVPPDANFVMRDAAELLGRRLEPTRLDRRRMDHIALAELQDSWLVALGEKQLVFYGRGGTGKTVILLGLAWRLQQQRGARILVLTYNRALVADLTRLLALMGLRDDVGHPVVSVQTVHSFLFRLACTLGLVSQDDNSFLARYDLVKQEVVSLLNAGALTAADIETLSQNEPEWFDWDHVFVDEAQDWPEDERDLLHQLYASKGFVIADGRDQLVRGSTNCDWTRGTPRLPSEGVSLSRGLRMKANLARFANELAQELGLTTWTIEANLEGGGGRVIFVEGDYTRGEQLHAELMTDAMGAGNACVDNLMCVPPTMAVQHSGSRQFALTDSLAAWGQAIWDGVSEDLRRSYPTDVDQLRVVQYDSCRGLEGWTVINLNLDEFFQYKRASWANAGCDRLSENDAALARRFASRWIMIPCTRAIDTLVLHVRNQESELAKAVRSVAARCGDFVEQRVIAGGT